MPIVFKKKLQLMLYWIHIVFLRVIEWFQFKLENRNKCVNIEDSAILVEPGSLNDINNLIDIKAIKAFYIIYFWLLVF